MCYHNSGAAVDVPPTLEFGAYNVLARARLQPRNPSDITEVLGPQIIIFVRCSRCCDYNPSDM